MNEYKERKMSRKWRDKLNQSKGFTLIELVVSMAIVAILVLLASPRFIGHTKEANKTKHIANVEVLEDAAERYYIDTGKWPRGEEEPYTDEEVTKYAERIRDITGEEIQLEGGNYWDIDYDGLSRYAKLPEEEDRKNYVLRNPVGKIYCLEELTEKGKSRESGNSSVGADGTEVELVAGESTDFDYSGEPQSITLPKGTYKLEVWGAKGGYTSGGKGGYASGTLNLSKETSMYVYVGEEGNSGDKRRIRSFNGGGFGYTLSGQDWRYRGAGGGASDIRLIDGAWDSSDGLFSRIIVAGGGGGGYHYKGTDYIGGDGGGSNGIFGSSAFGGTQTDGGTSTYSGADKEMHGTYGIGGNGSPARKSAAISGGGGGWYGGGGGNAAGGGSGYVLTNDSHKPSGYTPTSAFHMSNAQLIPGNQTMPDPKGGTMVGNSGDGYARITVLKEK